MTEKDKALMAKVAEVFRDLPDTAQAVALAYAEGMAAASSLAKSA